MSNVFNRSFVQSVNGLMGKVKIAVARTLGFNSTTPHVLELKDQDGNLIDSESVTIANVQNLQSSLDSKVAIASVLDQNGNVTKHTIASIAGVEIKETVTKLNPTALQGNILPIKLLNENGVEQVINADLSGLVTNSSGINNATYDASQNIITLEETDGDVWQINLGEFSIIVDIDAQGVATLQQEGVVKLTVSKVGQSGIFSDLLQIPTTLSGYGIVDAYTKIEVDNLLDDKSDVGHGHSVNDGTLDFYGGDVADDASGFGVFPRGFSNAAKGGASGATDTPLGTTYGGIVNVAYSDYNVFQMLYSNEGPHKLWWRYVNDIDPAQWQEIWHTGNLDPSTFSLLGHNHDDRYVNVTGDDMTGPLSIGATGSIHNVTISTETSGGNQLTTFKGNSYWSNYYFRSGWNNYRFFEIKGGYTGESYLILSEPNEDGTNASTTKISTRGSSFGSTVSSDGFIRNSSSDSYMLLGGGGHKLLSDFALADHNHDNLYFNITGDIVTGESELQNKFHITNAFDHGWYLYRYEKRPEEYLRFWMDDIIAHQHYKNDERHGSFLWTIENTDLETNAGANANTHTFKFEGDEFGARLLLDGNPIITSANIGDYQAGAHTHVKADITDFAEGDYVHVSGSEIIGGTKTFTGGVILNNGITPYVRFNNGTDEKWLFRSNSDLKWQYGATTDESGIIFHSNNHIHRTDAENDARYLQSLPDHTHNELISGTISDLNAIRNEDASRLTYNRFSSGALNESPGVVNNANGVITLQSHTATGGSYGKQIAFSDTDDLYIRRMANGFFGPWKKVLHDGIHSHRSDFDNDLRYVNADGDTMTAPLTVNSASINSIPNTDNAKYDGYGVIGNRANLYITNASATGEIVFGIGGAHNANVKAWFDADQFVSNVDIHAPKIINTNSSDSEILLGGGGTAPLSSIGSTDTKVRVINIPTDQLPANYTKSDITNYLNTNGITVAKGETIIIDVSGTSTGWIAPVANSYETRVVADGGAVENKQELINYLSI